MSCYIQERVRGLELANLDDKREGREMEEEGWERKKKKTIASAMIYYFFLLSYLFFCFASYNCASACTTGLGD